MSTFASTRRFQEVKDYHVMMNTTTQELRSSSPVNSSTLPCLHNN